MTPFRLLIFVLIMLKTNTYAQQFKQSVTPASHRISEYLPLLKGKAVAVFANHTSMIHNTHLVDTLRSKGINIKKIFAPEHGFRGTADAGSKIDNAIDPKTGIPVISLYGKKIRPSDDDLSNIDILVFDIQDVGVR
ncbi:MAG: exo-beta-N-acetylmuramidase NamZ domain-containing protein, partial [Flavitalea sp.]